MQENINKKIKDNFLYMYTSQNSPLPHKFRQIYNLFV